MGTSQRHKLLKTPEWSQSKKAMTGVINNPTPSNMAKFVRAFSEAVSHSGASGSYFGQRGGTVLGNFLDFLNAAKSDSETFLGVPVEELKYLNKNQILLKIYDKLVDTESSTPDDVAAQAALDAMLTEVFSDCENAKDIRYTLLNASDEQIEKWVIEYELTYILEYSAQIFQDHIFSKSKDPAAVFADIKDYMRQEIGEKLSFESGQTLLSFLSNKSMTQALTEKILKIWG